MYWNFTPNPSFLVYRNNSVQLMVRIHFPFPKVTLLQQRIAYCSYGFSFSLCTSQQCSQNPIAYSKELHITLYLLDWPQKKRLFRAFSVQLDPHLLCCTDYPL